MKLDLESLGRAATEARGLAIDAVHACSSGHLGLPLGCAEIGAALFGAVLRYDPADPRWLGRDRLVLSAGHGSMFLYGWLHLAGYRLSLDQVRSFRQLDSGTPGHPEFGETPGVEATTGPLGQGVGNAVGYAISQKMAAARFSAGRHAPFDWRVYCLAGDGCLQEGVAAEASALAGHLQLDNLILIYDANDVTLDAMAAATQSEDTAKRYEAYGFDVQRVDGHDLPAVVAALDRARTVKTGRPQLIIAKTLIGKGIPEVAGTAKAHGEGGAKFAAAARQALGLPAEPFFVSAATREFFAARQMQLAAEHAAWQERYAAWRSERPDLAELLEARPTVAGPGGAGSAAPAIPEFPADATLATRKAGSEVLQAVAGAMPLLISGSADLHGSTLNYLGGSGDFGPVDHGARNIRFGIREHAMGAILNGIAYDGIFRASGATFLVFADYLRPAIRVAALAGLPVVYIFTHDSVGVGEDGPTHQPVETVSSLRVIPNLDVIRPADPEETAGAFLAAVGRTDGPTALILTRQTVPSLAAIPVADRRDGVLRGAYIARRETGALRAIILASGSELQHALAAADQLGTDVRVVSMPCWERFGRQPAAYREEVLPAACRRRVAIEAGVSTLWHRYVGLDGRVIGIDRFGLSAPGGTVMKKLGITAEAVVVAVSALSSSPAPSAG